MNLDEDKLNSVGLDSVSIEGYRVSRNTIYGITESIEDTLSWKDPDEHIINLYIKIMGIGLEDEEIEIGRVKCNYIEQVNPFLKDCDFYNICDYVFGDLEPMASAVIDKKTCYIKDYISKWATDNILYIDKLIIEPKYRNIGIGSFILQNLDDIIEYTIGLSKPDCTIVLPQPLKRSKDGDYSNMSKTQSKKYEQKLIKFYKDSGFRKVRGTRYLYRNY